jgi:HEAT repeat protein
MALACLIISPNTARAQVTDIFEWIQRGFSNTDNPQAERDDIEEDERGQAIVTEGGLTVFFRDTYFGTTNAYGPGGVRFFATRMVLENGSEQDVSIPSSEIELDADGTILHVSENNEQMSQIAIRSSRSHVNLGQQGTPETISVPAGATRAVWLTFTDVPGSIRTPKLLLRMPVAGTNVSIDITGFHTRLLGLSREKLGPGGCVCLMRIDGQLNSINASDLVDAISEELNQDISRFVICWPEEAEAIGDEIVQWLITSRMPPGFGWYSNSALLPTLPGDTKELNLVRLPNDEGFAYYGRSINGVSQGTPAFADEDSAVIDALRSVAIGMSAEALTEEIAKGHPLSRTAMLVHGAHLLPPSALPLVMEFAESDSEQLRLAAIGALAEFPDAPAIEMLKSLAEEGSDAQRRSAIESLARSRFPLAHETLVRMLEADWTIERLAMIEILARHPRAEWNSHVSDAARDPDNSVRLVAIRALARLGHPERLQLLTEALAAEDEGIRAEAFQQLLTFPDPAAHEVVIGETIRVMREDGLTAEVQNALNQYSDPRLVDALLERFRSSRQGRNETAEYLVRMADDETINEVLEVFDELQDNSQNNIMQWLMQMEHSRLGEFARRCLKTNNPNLVQMAVNALRVEGSDESVALILETIRNTTDTSSWYMMCQQVVYSGGGPEIEEILLEARNSNDVERRRRAVELLKNLRYRSPAGQVVQYAEQYIYEEKWEEAIQVYDIALEIDDEYSAAYSARGGARLHLEQDAEAEQDFLKALELDPFDGYAITGLASVMASRNEIEAALAKVDEHAELFLDDYLYSYNVACVCGRGMKAIDALPEGERDAELREQLLDRAIGDLSRSFESGGIELELIEKDPDLDALREEPRFQELLDPFRENLEGGVFEFKIGR